MPMSYGFRSTHPPAECGLAAALAPQPLWPAVAGRYRMLAAELVEARDVAVA